MLMDSYTRLAGITALVVNLIELDYNQLVVELTVSSYSGSVTTRAIKRKAELFSRCSFNLSCFASSLILD